MMGCLSDMWGSRIEAERSKTSQLDEFVAECKNIITVISKYRITLSEKPKPMKASEAKKIADSKKKSIAEIFEMIEEAANEGNTCIFIEKKDYDFSLSDHIRSMGYNVHDYGLALSIYGINISWEEPTV